MRMVCQIRAKGGAQKAVRMEHGSGRGLTPGRGYPAQDKNLYGDSIMKNRKALQYSVAFMLLVLSPVAGSAGQKPGPPGPPPEAISACTDKNEGDTVTFVDRHGESVAATCAAFNGMLVAAPEGQHMGMPCPDNPPLEAVSACTAKQEGDKVTFAGPGDESFSGICKTVKGVLVAVPDEPAAK